MVVYLSKFIVLPVSALLVPKCHVSMYYQFIMTVIRAREEKLLQKFTQGTPNDDQDLRVEFHM